MKTDIWNINDKFYCPVAGFCLSPSEQVLIVKKFIVKREQSRALKRIHDAIIDIISEKSVASKYVQKLLDKKYKEEIALSLAIEPLDRIKELEKYLNWQNFGAYLWISSRYLDLKDIGLDTIMNKSHLYSHEMFHQLQQSEFKNIQLENENEFISDKYSGIKRQLKNLKKKIKAEEQKNYQLESRLTNALREQVSVENKQCNESLYLEKISELKKLKDKQNLNILELDRINKQLSKRLNKQNGLFLEIEKDFKKLIGQLQKEQNNNCSSCNKVDLCHRKILIVGGLTKMENFYRKLVTETGGLFYYHDGYSKQGESALSNLVNLSDVVICPVDINSHFACLQVKKFCKKTNTDYHMLRTSSLSSIYNTLKRVASNEN